MCVCVGGNGGGMVSMGASPPPQAPRSYATELSTSGLFGGPCYRSGHCCVVGVWYCLFVDLYEIINPFYILNVRS